MKNTAWFMLRSFCATLPLLIFAVASVAVAGAQNPALVFSFEVANEGIYGPFPTSVMAQGRDGNLYGTSYSGGTNTLGGVFMITPSGGQTVVHNFTSAEGSHCNMGLTLGNDGNFYGACLDGGTSNEGMIYQLTPSGVLTILHSFTNTGSDGGEPNAPPIQASDGNFYGTTELGGTNHDGTVFKLTPAGVFTTIHSFVFPNDSATPWTPLVEASDGNLYGTTAEGSGSGAVFKVTTSGKLTVLHNFLASSDGALPMGALIQGADGELYGTTNLDGANGEGTIYKINTAGKFSVLEAFNSTVDGQGEPWVGMVQATDGNYYGVTFRLGLPQMPQNGGIYKLTSKGVYSSLDLFDGFVGANPASALIQHTNGLLYGNTQNGGEFNVGTAYSYNIGAKPFCSLLTGAGSIGTQLGILGQGFSSAAVVRFAGVKASSVIVSGSGYLTATVPAGALTGAVTVTSGPTKLTSKQVFRVTPVLKTFSPTSGAIGTLVTITGSGFTQTSKVTFDNASASFIVNSDTQLTATVPAGASTGKIAVTTAGGTTLSNKNFTVN